MIIGNFYLVGIAFTPDKANAPLIVDANTVLRGGCGCGAFTLPTDNTKAGDQLQKRVITAAIPSI